jgi:cobalt-zinc-cadmium efflux system membrane fusion protein
MSRRSFVVAAVAMLGACTGASHAPESGAVEEASSDVVSFAPEAIERSGFVSVAVEMRPLGETLEVTGRIQLDEDETARVGSPAEGRVSQLFVALGDVVRAGDPLLDIHSHELISARSDYAKAETSVVAAEKKHLYAEMELARAERLFEAKALSERERLLAASELSSAEAELARARSELARAEHYLAHLGVDPGAGSQAGDLTIRAPISGIVLDRAVTVGTVVNPADHLVILSNLRTLWVVGEVPERLSSSVARGQDVTVEVAAYPGERFSARVFHVGERLDPELRTVVVRCRLENPDGKLRPEMYAKLFIEQGEALPVLLVPEAAVQRIDGETVVFVDLGEGRFERRRVSIGRTVNATSEIRDGLTEGERVVSEGSFLVKTEFLRGRIEEE